MNGDGFGDVLVSGQSSASSAYLVYGSPIPSSSQPPTTLSSAFSVAQNKSKYNTITDLVQLGLATQLTTTNGYFTASTKRGILHYLPAFSDADAEGFGTNCSHLIVSHGRVVSVINMCPSVNKPNPAVLSSSSSGGSQDHSSTAVSSSSTGESRGPKQCGVCEHGSCVHDAVTGAAST